MAHFTSIAPSVRPCTILWNAVFGATNFSRRATLSPGCVSVSAQLQQRWNVFNNNGMSLSTYTYSSQSRLISSGQYRLLNAIIARFSHGIAVLIMVVVCGVEVHMRAWDATRQGVVSGRSGSSAPVWTGDVTHEVDTNEVIDPVGIAWIMGIWWYDRESPGEDCGIHLLGDWLLFAGSCNGMHLIMIIREKWIALRGKDWTWCRNIKFQTWN